MNKLPLWALEIGPLQNFASFFSSSLQRAQKANYIINFVILAILTSKGCPTLVFVFKPEGPLLGGGLFYLIELKHRLDDLPQKSNTGSDCNNDNKNISMSSWDRWIKFCSCQNWMLSSSAWCLELKPPKFFGKALNFLKYVFLIIYIHIIFFIISIYIGTHF